MALGHGLPAGLFQMLLSFRMDGKPQPRVLGRMRLNVFLDQFPVRKYWIPSPSGPPCLLTDVPVVVQMYPCDFGPPSVGLNLGLPPQLGARKVFWCPFGT